MCIMKFLARSQVKEEFLVRIPTNFVPVRNKTFSSLRNKHNQSGIHATYAIACIRVPPPVRKLNEDSVGREEFIHYSLSMLID